MLKAAGRQFGLQIVTEVMDPRKVELVAEHCDILQIGARNMQNYDLLREAGRSGMPVLLKRGLSARIEEWLLAGFLIFLVGLGIDVVIAFQWAEKGFKNLFAVREALFALTLTVIGLQLVFSSFLLSILNINSKTVDVPVETE